MKGSGIVLLFVCVFVLALAFMSGNFYYFNTSDVLSEGVFSFTEYDAVSSLVQLYLGKNNSLPDNGIYNSTTGINMTGNVLLLHMEDRGPFEFPDSALDDSDGDTGINMSDNLLLLHMNNNWNDASGQSNDGSATNAVFTTFSKIGGHAGGFDGDGDYVEVADFDSSAGEMTVAAWFRTDVVNTDMGLIDKWGTPAEASFTMIISGNKTLFYTYNGSGEAGINTGDEVTDGEWHHVVGVHNGTDNLIYLDGSLKNSDNAPARQAGGTTINIGSRHGFAYFNGSIDEVAFWNRSLSAGEIENIFNNQSPLMSDFSGQSNTVIGRGGINFSSEKKIGNYSCQMNGEGGYVSVSDSDSLDAEDLTVSGWAKFDEWYDGSCNANMILSKGADSDNGNYRFFVIDDVNCGVASGVERAIFAITLANGTAINSGYSMPLSLGTWYHLVGVHRNGSGMELYVNGLLANSTSNYGTIGGNEKSLTIGSMDLSGYEYWVNGSLDEVAIWNRSLSALEIQNIYSSQAGKYLASGSYESNVTDLGQDMIFNNLSWYNESSSGVILNLSARSCDDELCDVESWINFGTDSPANLTGRLNDSQYFQYKFDFGTNNNSFSPKLYNVTLDYLKSAMPDLFINESLITYSPTEIRQGDTVVFNLTLENVGNENATDANVSFYVGGIFNDSFTQNLSNGSNLNIQFNWSAVVINHTFSFFIDVANSVRESNETNNNVSFELNVSRVLVLNYSSPVDGDSVPRGKYSGSLPHEDALNTVLDAQKISARVYDFYNESYGAPVNCSFYFNSVLLGKNMTNSSGDCEHTFDKTLYSAGDYLIEVNFSDLEENSVSHTSQINDSATLTIFQVLTDLEPLNQRSGSYNKGDAAVLDINVTVDGTLTDVTNITVYLKNTGGGVLLSENYPGGIERLSEGLYQSVLILNSTDDIHWDVEIVNGTTNFSSSKHADVVVNGASAYLNASVLNSTGDFLENSGIVIRDRNGYELLSNSSLSFELTRDSTLNDLYTLEFYTMLNSSLTLTQINLSENFTISPNFGYNISNDVPSNTTAGSNVLALNVSGLAFANATVTLARIDDSNVSTVLSCNDWDYENGNCFGTWVYNSSKYSGLSYNDTHVWFTVTSFSAYVAGDGENISVGGEDVEDSEDTSVDETSGGSSSSGDGSFVPFNFNLDPNTLSFRVGPGSMIYSDFVIKDLRLFNTTILVESDFEFCEFNRSIDLSVDEEKKIEFVISVPEDTLEGTYLGEIVVSSPSIKKSVSLSVAVIVEKDSLFGIYFEEDYQKIFIGDEKLVFQVNLGEVQNYSDSAEVAYRIIGYEGDVVLEEVEIRDLVGVHSFAKSLKFSELLEGRYYLSIEIGKDEETSVVSGFWFDVVDEEIWNPFVEWGLFYSVTAIAGFLVVLLLLFLFVRSRLRT